MQMLQTYRERITKLALCLAMVLFAAAANAQNFNTSFTSSLLADSMVANSNKDFLYNNLTINNTTSGKLNMVITITVPGSWQIITQNVVTLALNPNESTIIPMRLLPANSTNANWE